MSRPHAPGEPRKSGWRIARRVKLAYSLFAGLLVPVYWRRYGPGNFLWFSDIAFLSTLAALWLDSALLASMMAVGVLPLELLWIADFLSGGRLAGLSAYMFDRRKPLTLRGLSLFHIVVPAVLVRLLWRLGYDRRAPIAQTLLAWVVLPLTYRLTDPRRNINRVFGPGSRPQRRIPPRLYLALLMAALPVVVYLPTHAALRRIFAPPRRPEPSAAPAVLPRASKRSERRLQRCRSAKS